MYKMDEEVVPSEEGTVVELPPSAQETAAAATAAATAALTEVKQIEVSALTEVTTMVMTILSEVKELLIQAQGMFQEAETQREEAVDLALALRNEETEETNENGSYTPNVTVSQSGIKEVLRKIL
jgi:hypothetical protein